MTARKHVVDDDVLTLARRRVAEVFDRFDLPVVSFSGGKDSTVVLNLALEELRRRRDAGDRRSDERLHVIFWDEEAIHPETIDYVARVAADPDVDMHWYCLPWRHVNACSTLQPFWYPWAPEDHDKWVRDVPPGGITEPPPGFNRDVEFGHSMGVVLPRDGRTVGVMLGIRADESMQRFRSVANKVHDNWVSRDVDHGHVFKCKPIYDWTTLDVWTAPRAFGWDWNRAYDVMAKAGLSPSSQRVCQPFGQQPLTNLWQWRICWPELWGRLTGRVDGAATAMRYANSPLYASGSDSVSRGEDETWEQAIAREISKWEPEMQQQLSRRLRVEIQRHNRKMPGVPIPETEPPLDLETGISSGLTYEFLLRVATKGDVKNRMVPRQPNAREIEARRVAAWGENWRESHPEAAKNRRWKRHWDRGTGKWVYVDSEDGS